MKSLEYIKFVISKVEAEFLGYSNSREYVKVITVLHSLKVTDNLLRDIYILSGIKKLRQLSSYLIFMIKKLESGSINIDNFMENYSTDKHFLASYFQTYYDLEQISQEEFVTEEINTKFIFEEEKNAASNPVYSLAESNFKVADLDNELVTEEFRDTSINENYSDPGDVYMKLVEGEITADTNADNGSVFFTDVSEDVFDLPGQGEKTTTVLFEGGLDGPETEKEQTESTDKTKINSTIDNDLNDVVNKVTVVEESVPVEKNPSLADFFEKFDEETIVPAEDTGHITPVTVSSHDEEIINRGEPEEVLQPEKSDAKEKIKERAPDEIEILQNLIPEPPEPETRISEEEEIEADKEVDKKLREIEKETSEEILNSEFIKYENFLYDKNKIIRGLLDDLVLIVESNEPDLDNRNRILEEIFPILENLKSYSEKMSFEIITGIYDSLAFCFDLKFKDIMLSKENISVFVKSLNGVEDLIKGNELTGFDNIISRLKLIQEELGKLLADRENFEKKKYNFGEEENNLIKEFKDSSEYDAYIILRDKITELEETFRVIADMKDKTYPFESIRKLSVTFALFREIVNISRILEMNKIAHLAEAGYVFVKFVQNYRIDPFKDEVSEVFKYLIYSFKLIYLDKPVKDFDTFVSFLNEPVKIFYPKNKTHE